MKRSKSSFHEFQRICLILRSFTFFIDVLIPSKNYPVRFDNIYKKYWYRYIMSYIFKIHVQKKNSLVLWNTVESLKFMGVSVHGWSKLLLVCKDILLCAARLVHYSWHIHSFLRNTCIGAKRWTINQSIKQSVRQSIIQSINQCSGFKLEARFRVSLKIHEQWSPTNNNDSTVIMHKCTIWNLFKISHTIC